MGKYAKSDLSRFNGRVLSPKIILITPQSKLFTSNTLIFDDEIKLVVDTGFQHGTGQLRSVRDFFNIGSDDSVFFSHYHIDHTIGSYIFSQSSKLIHGTEKDALVNEETFLKFCYQYNLNPSEYNKWKPRFLSFLEYEELSEWSDLTLNNIQSIDTSNPLDLGKTSLDILHLPGHSPGHCGLYEPDSRILFIGDIDLSKFGPWYGWRNANLQSFRESLVNLKQFIEENEISLIITSHSSPIENKQDCLLRLENYCKIFDERKRRILEFIIKHQPEGTTIGEITKQSLIYQGKKSTPPFVFETFERFMVEHHLEELTMEGHIDYEGDRVISC